MPAISVFSASTIAAAFARAQQQRAGIDDNDSSSEDEQESGGSRQQPDGAPEVRQSEEEVETDVGPERSNDRKRKLQQVSAQQTRMKVYRGWSATTLLMAKPACSAGQFANSLNTSEAHRMRTT
ncbi:DDE-1 domain-containing protein [Plasmodiophora brassicae]